MRFLTAVSCALKHEQKSASAIAGIHHDRSFLESMASVPSN